MRPVNTEFTTIIDGGKYAPTYDLEKNMVVNYYGSFGLCYTSLDAQE